jgi:hypothetical protein
MLLLHGLVLDALELPALLLLLLHGRLLCVPLPSLLLHLGSQRTAGLTRR